MSTYSPNLRIELIGDGEQTGVWGNTTNKNLGQLLEQAITGYLALQTITSPEYLQATDGSLDEARNMVVSLSTTTGAAFSVAIPPKDKVYVFANTSAHDATVYASNAVNTTSPYSGGDTVVVPAGKAKLVYCIGASGDVVEAVTSAAAFSVSSLTAGTINASSAVISSLSATSVDLSSPLPTTEGGTGSSSTTYCSLTSNVSGTLPPANGGTGQTSYTDGQILIGNTTGNTLAKGTITGTSNQVTVTNGAGTITLSLPQNIHTAATPQFGSLGVGTAASGTTGEIRATNNVTAYYSSDERLKENIHEITDALGALDKIRGVRYDWKDAYIDSVGGEDKYFMRKNDVGLIAQEVEQVLPEIVATREDGYKAIKYERVVALLVQAVKELKEEVATLRGERGA
jgi:hypothetical protein